MPTDPEWLKALSIAGDVAFVFGLFAVLMMAGFAVWTGVAVARHWIQATRGDVQGELEGVKP